MSSPKRSLKRLKISDSESEPDTGSTEISPCFPRASSMWFSGNANSNLKEIVGEEVEILVGPSMTPFIVHDKLLRDSSPFFRGALSGRWKKSKERLIKLPDDAPHVFSIFVHWVYYKTIPGFRNDVASEALDEGDIWISLAKAYILGDKLLCRDFQYRITGCFMKMISSMNPGNTHWPFNHKAIKILYEGTHSSDPIRKLAVDTMITLDWEEAREAFSSPTLPEEFLVDVIREIFSLETYGTFDEDQASKPRELLVGIICTVLRHRGNIMISELQVNNRYRHKE